MPEESVMAVFEEIIDHTQNALVREAMDAGRIPIGYTCSFVPEVLLSVDRLFPLRLRAPGIGGTQLADIYLPPIICSYCKSLLEYGMNGNYDFIGGWVLNFSCQHMNRLSDVVKNVVKPPFLHVLDALHTCTENTKAWMVDELQELTERLSNHFDVVLFQELRYSCDGVTCVHPGGISTNMARNARFGRSSPFDRDQFIKLVEKLLRTTPDHTAKRVVNAIRKRKPRLIVGLDAFLAYNLGRIFPVAVSGQSNR